MSLELYVVISGNPLPARDQIERFALGEGVKLAIDPFDWTEQAGFLPMVLNDVRSGVETDLATVDQLIDAEDLLAELDVDDQASAVVFRWEADLRECACAYITAAALAQVSGGRIIDPQSGEELSQADAVGEAKSALSHVK